MLSRTAENLFWMARYMERAEATSRLLTMGQRMAILPGAHHRDEWRSVVRATGAGHQFPEGTIVTESDAIAFLMLDLDNPSSIRSCLLKARANAKTRGNANRSDGRTPPPAPVALVAVWPAVAV